MNKSLNHAFPSPTASEARGKFNVGENSTTFTRLQRFFSIAGVSVDLFALASRNSFQREHKNILRLRRDTQVNYIADNVITRLAFRGGSRSRFNVLRCSKIFRKRRHNFPPLLLRFISSSLRLNGIWNCWCERLDGSTKFMLQCESDNLLACSGS